MRRITSTGGNMRGVKDNEVEAGPLGALVIVSDDGSAASIVVLMDSSSPRRFKALEVDSDGARLRRNDGKAVRLVNELSVIEAAARCETVVVREIDLAGLAETEYPIEVMGLNAAPGMSR